MRSLRVLLVCALLTTSAARGAFSTAPGYSSTELYSSAGTFTLPGGLSCDAGSLYFAQYTEVFSLDLSSRQVQAVGTLPDNVDTPVAIRCGGQTHVAYGLSYSFPYPYRMGVIAPDGRFNELLAEDGIYDAAVNGAGECYVVANPDATGSSILRYDPAGGPATVVVNPGGYSGGIAFDADGNLYYAEQTAGQIWKFTAQQVAAAQQPGGAGPLTANDAEALLDITAGYLAFDDAGYLYATTGWGALLAKYDLTTAALVEEVAYGGIGKVLWYDDALYAINTDWGTYAGTVQEIVPEPATIGLLAAAAPALLLHARREKRRA